MHPRLLDLAALFLKLGTIGFGGPAVHIAIMEEETVKRRGWLSREDFLDMVGATNLIPGPNSTEMAMHVGYRQAGFVGLVVAGACFILPAVLVTTLFAWLYIQLGQLPQMEPALEGIKPAVLAIIVAALWRLGGKAFKNVPLSILAGAVVFAELALPPGYEIHILLAASAAGVLLLWVLYPQKKAAEKQADKEAETGSGIDDDNSETEDNPPPSAVLPIATGTGAAATASAAPLSLWQLGLFFLKVGAVLYGSGYVLIAYLKGGLVEDFGWLSEAELLDAIAIGQFTPGPILSTASFIGFILLFRESSGSIAAGLQGAAVASVAIFLPSFFFVAALGPIVPRLRKNVWAGRFLDAVNAASIGLMAAVTIALCLDVLLIEDPETARMRVRWGSLLIAAVAGVLLLKWKLSPAWLVAGGAIAGWLLSQVS